MPRLPKVQTGRYQVREYDHGWFSFNAKGNPFTFERGWQIVDTENDERRVQSHDRMKNALRAAAEFNAGGYVPSKPQHFKAVRVTHRR